MSLLRAVTVAVLLCSVAAVDDGLSTSGVRVTVYADTILEADGHSAIPPLFGIMSARCFLFLYSKLTFMFPVDRMAV